MLSLNDGIIHYDIIEGSFDTELFYTFVMRLLDQIQPFPAPNSVIIMDNCHIHKHPTIVDLIESRYVLFIHLSEVLTSLLVFRGMRVKFLPPYSPDYNPIELAFSAMKYHLHHNGAYVHFAMVELLNTEVFCTLLEALYQITAADVFGWYRHCGYV